MSNRRITNWFKKTKTEINGISLKEKCLLGVVFVAFGFVFSPFVFGQSFTIPADTTFNLNAGTLNVPGDLYIETDGTLYVTSGTITVTGNWSNDGTFTAGTGTVNFTGAGTQSIDSGGIGAGNLFYNFIHSGGSTLTLSNFGLDVDGDFTSSAGTFNTGGLDMSIYGDWDSTGGTFNSQSNTVTFDGTDQGIYGANTFYNLSKTVAAAATLTFEGNVTQTIDNSLTLQGNSGAALLGLVSDAGVGNDFGISLQTGGTQSITDVAVQNSDATVGGGLTLVAQGASTCLNATGWICGAASLTWEGDVSSDWEVGGNWNLGFVPSADDTVTIPDVTGGGDDQPVLTAAVTVTNITIDTDATLTTSGQSFTVSNNLYNDGTIILTGGEPTVDVTYIDSDSGTFRFVGNGDGTPDTFTVPDFGSGDYYNIIFNDATGLDTFRTTTDMQIYGDFTNTLGTVDIDTNADALNIDGNLYNTGGTLTATGGNIYIDSDIDISGGTFTAPESGQSFTVAGDFTQSGGTFDADDGTIIFNGTGQTISASGTTFYNFTKAVTTADTFRFDDAISTANAPVITGMLTLTGVSGNELTILSDNAGTAAYVRLQAGATQDIDWTEIGDIDADPDDDESTVLWVARNSTENPALSTDHISFGGVTVVWEGDTSTDWEVASNWDLGIVPTADDTAEIGDVVNDPILTAAANVEDLSIYTDGIVSLAGFDLTVDDQLYNDGTVQLLGSETTVSITRMDTDSGTFVYLGNGAPNNTHTVKDFGTRDYFNLTFNDVNATTDDFDLGADLSIYGDLTVTGGAFAGDGFSMNVDGSVYINGGDLTAPGAGETFTVGDNWSNTAGTFTDNGGEVTFDTSATATITGDTTFEDLTTTVAGKTFAFADGSTQTINGTLTMTGALGNLINLDVVGGAGASQFALDVTASDQIVQFINVDNSDAETNQIVCTNCTDGGDNNANWIFFELTIDVPLDSEDVDTTPTIIGSTNANQNVRIRESVGGNIIASVTSDANGNFRVEVDSSTPLADNTLYTLTPEVTFSGVGTLTGNGVDVTSLPAPTTTQVPTIVTPADGTRVSAIYPTFTGAGAAGETVVVKAADEDGNLLLQTVGTDTVDGTGAYSVTLTTPLVKGTNYVSVTVDGVASEIFDYQLTDPFGVVFDSNTDALLEGVTVTLINNDTGLPAVPGTELDAADVNPVVTGADGFYSFIAADGDYRFLIEKADYTYPSFADTFPVTRTVTTGSKGEVFTVAGVILEIDQPMDQTGIFLRIEKNANKEEVVVGEVVTYTITIENTGTINVGNVFIHDEQPPGFKFIPGRATLDGNGIDDTNKQRPLRFEIGTVTPGEIKTLKYQLVVGSGVTQGDYDNRAIAKLQNGIVASNQATETVKVVLDPLFDLGATIGKVFFDHNENGIQDAPAYDPLEGTTTIEEPIANVRIVMEDGTVIKTDKEGKFNVKALVPGRHLFRIDERTLPEGSYLTTDKVVVVDITEGLTTKVNFGVALGEQRYTSEEEQFFIRKVKLIQETSKPVPKLNVAMFEEALTFYDEELVDPVKFRIFSNYTPFIDKWKFEIVDKDTRRLIFTQEGSRYNITKPIIWDGRDQNGEYIRDDRRYEYLVIVEDKHKQFDETEPIIIRMNTIEKVDKEEDLKTYREERRLAQTKYDTWAYEQSQKSNLKIQTIRIEGETLIIDRLISNVDKISILEGGNLVSDVEIIESRPATAKDILEGRELDEFEETPVEIILPNGDYEIVVQERGTGPVEVISEEELKGLDKEERMAIAFKQAEDQARARVYTKGVEVGDNQLFFVAMGDAKAGFTFKRNDVEDVARDDKYKQGFWSEGKLAYYLEGKIKGKYIITSSFDTERDKKELFRNLDDDQYYPVYGDASKVDYKATDTQGPLYLLVEWDKSSAIWGNYKISFGDTEFAQWSRTLYGGKVDFESLAATKYGAPRTEAVVFRARADQRSAHNEILATGGSLYYLKHQGIIQGSDKVKIEVRDNITGLVISSREMVEGADYEMDYEDGRMLFWRPVNMLVQSYSIVDDDLLDGHLVYVVADYEYDVGQDFDQSTYGARVRQAITDEVLVGTTYVTDTQEDADYLLRGVDVTLQLGKDAQIVAEYAKSDSEAQNAFVSTDGGLTYSELGTSDSASGKAFGLRADVTLFNKLVVKSHYKWVENNFSTSATTAQQGKEVIGLQVAYDINEKSRIKFDHEIQTLIDDGNLQTSLQVGAHRTTNTMLQYVQEFKRLKLTAEYQRKVLEEKTATGDLDETVTDTIAAEARYEVSEKVEAYIKQQASLQDEGLTQTTLGVEYEPSEKVAVLVEEVISEKGAATRIEADVNLTGAVKLTGDYKIARDEQGGIKSDAGTEATVGIEAKVTDEFEVKTAVGTKDFETAKASVGVEGKVNEQLDLRTSVDTSSLFTESSETTFTLGATSQLDSSSKVDTEIVMVDADKESEAALKFTGTTKVDETTEATSGVTIIDKFDSDLQRSFTFGTRKKIRDDLTMISSRTLGTDKDGESLEAEYSLVREKNGRKFEGSLSRKYKEDINEVSSTNIFGLSGDITDRWALSANIERGDVQHLDGRETFRQAYAFGVGYVKKDPETGKTFKSSTKIELIKDSGDGDTEQYLVRNATEGWLTQELSLFGKVEVSQTKNLDTDTLTAESKEFVVGAAYRPLYHDKLNLLSRYTYLENRGPEGQENDEDVVEERASVFAMDMIYDLNERWQITEKFAYRVLDEKVAGFDFIRTNTWLMIHRLNYKFEQDWSIGAEFRTLTQLEAKDTKRGFLIEAARQIGEYAQLGIGYNFTDFSDDLTELDYTAHGPFIRLTGQFYDQTEEERKRAKEKWLEAKVTRWAWIIVNDELNDPNSMILRQLNEYFDLAQIAYQQGDDEKALALYKDIIMAGQMMFVEAADYIRSRIDREKELERMYKLADQYYKNGQYEEAKKILEKLLEEVNDD